MTAKPTPNRTAPTTASDDTNTPTENFTDPNTQKNDNLTESERAGTRIGPAGDTAFRTPDEESTTDDEEPMITHRKEDGSLADPVPVKDWPAYEKKNASDIR